MRFSSIPYHEQNDPERSKLLNSNYVENKSRINANKHYDDVWLNGPNSRWSMGFRQSNHSQSVCKQNCLFQRVICIVRFICFHRNELAEFPAWIIIKRRITIYPRLNVCDNWRMLHSFSFRVHFTLINYFTFIFSFAPLYLYCSVLLYTFCYFYSIYVGNNFLRVIINIWRGWKNSLVALSDPP